MGEHETNDAEAAPVHTIETAKPKPNTFGATEEELEWARNIKGAVTTSGLPTLTDFEYLQHALVAKANVRKALKRMQGLAAFRKTYKLTTMERDEPMALLKRTNDMFPGLLVGVGVDNLGRCVQICESKAFDPTKLKGEEEWRTMMGAFYYLFQAMQADVESIRNGIVFAADCEKMGWKNFSLEIEKRAAEFYSDAYPIRMKQIYMLDMPKILNVMIDIVKVFLSKKIKDVIQNIEAEKYFRSGELPKHLIPPQRGGEAKPELSFKFLEDKLRLRAQNEAEFRL